MAIGRLAVLQVLRVDQVTAEVLTALAAEAIPALLLKGPTLEPWTLPGERPRLYVDTDLLVAPSQLRATHAVLARLGFEQLLRDGEVPGKDKAMHWIRWRDEANVDLHVNLTGVGAPPERFWSVIQAHVEPFEVAGATARALDAPARALHVALHAAQHGPTVHPPLRDLRGALTLATPETWRQAAALASELEALPAFGAGLRLDPDGARLADELPAGAVLGIEEMLRVESGPPLTLGLHVFADLPWRARLRMIVRELAPSPSFMRIWSGMARRGRGGLLLAYLWRPVWLLLSLPRALVALRRARRISAR